MTLALILPASGEARQLEGAAGNVFESVESEIVFNTSAEDFAARAGLSISVDKARQILVGMGFNLPAQITSEARLGELIREALIMTPEQVAEFAARAGK